jgi:anti-sigma B factor antagonist
MAHSPQCSRREGYAGKSRATSAQRSRPAWHPAPGRPARLTASSLLRVFRPVLRGSVTVVCLRGELDVLDAPALQACLGDIRWPGRPRSIIDLTGLEFIDCACLAVLARYARSLRDRGGAVELVGPYGAVRRILSVTGLLAGLEVRDTEGLAAGDGVRRTVIFPAAREARPAADASQAFVRYLPVRRNRDEHYRRSSRGIA